MSFRYTNNLVATLKHRLQLEAAHRQLVRQTFTGSCNGIEVTCSAYGTVLGIRMLDHATWEPQYRVADADASSISSSSSSSSADAASKASSTSPSSTPAPSTRGIDLVKLSASIQAATWQAIQRIRSAKEEAHARSLRHNPRLLAKADVREWYEQDATTLHPRPADALTSLLGTEWMQAVRFGLPQPARFLSGAAKADEKAAEKVGGGGAKKVVTALSESDADAANIPIGSVHRLFTPALVQMELDPALHDASTASNKYAASAATTASSPSAFSSSRVDTAYLLREQRKEMRANEEAFWERVELIRRSQLAAIPKGEKRNYAEMAATLHDNTAEKVQLRFTQ